MSKTILITGSSTGIGRATATYFANHGWKVAATMRTPEKESELQTHENIEVFRLDVTDQHSIDAAIASTIEAFGKIDVVLNNAGYGTAGPFEAATKDQVKRQFDTNLFGLFDVTRAALPHFRERKSGLFINISSIGGLVTLPTFSLYHSTKWAVEGFSESLAYELRPLGIHVKLVEPGGVSTDFAGRSLDFLQKEGLTDYDPTIQKITALFSDPERSLSYSSGEQIAEVIFEAATDGKTQLRYLAGDDAKEFWAGRQQLGDDAFHGMITERFLGEG
ncbi:MAG: SDR family oxidoreductase [Salibacteraceae bacterium]|mgnify:CR=1 FL=1